MALTEQLDKLIEYLDKCKAHKTLGPLEEQIRGLFDVVGAYHTGYRGGWSTAGERWLWQRDGVFFRITTNEDRMGQDHSLYTELCVGHVRDSQGFTLATTQALRMGGTENNSLELAADRQPELWEYVERLEGWAMVALTKREVMSFLRSYNASPSVYHTLPDQIAASRDVAHLALEGIYRDCAAMYQEQCKEGWGLRTNLSQPQDFTSYRSAEECFWVNLSRIAESVGMTRHFKELDIKCQGLDYLDQLDRPQEIEAVVLKQEQLTGWVRDWEIITRDVQRLVEGDKIKEQAQMLGEDINFHEDRMAHLSRDLQRMGRVAARSPAGARITVFLWGKRRMAMERQAMERMESEIKGLHGYVSDRKTHQAWMQDRLDALTANVHPDAHLFKTGRSPKHTLAELQAEIQENEPLAQHASRVLSQRLRQSMAWERTPTMHMQRAEWRNRHPAI